MNNLYKFLLIIIFSNCLNAQIIEVNQLFNKNTTKVKKENFSQNKTFYAKTSLDESKIFDVVTRFDGYITHLDASKPYMNIKKGDRLFSIYSQEILALQEELQVTKNLNKSLYLSSIKKIENLAIQRSEIEKIKKGEISLTGIDFFSNIDGILIKKNVNQNSFVKKDSILLQLASLEKIWVIANVYQSDLKYIKENLNAKIYIDGLDLAINAKVDFIYPIFNNDTNSVDVRFIIDNKDLNLYANMFAKVDIQVEEKSMLTLPKTAVLKKSNDYFIFKPLKNGEFEPVKIKAKRVSSNKYEILSGVKENEEVINNALFLLDSDAITNALYESEDEDW